MKHIRPALVLTLFFVVVTGIAFPVVVWAIGNVVFPAQAHGSLMRDTRGHIVGSELIGQSFTKPEYFHPRPSAAGAGYDAANSGGTNLGPASDKLIRGSKDDPATKHTDEAFIGFEALARAYRLDNGLTSDAMIPADAATRSASGLDPDISPKNAETQIPRVARARQLSPQRVRNLVAANTTGRTWRVFGEPRVNVLKLNLALDDIKR
jgi:K+-transporting ATPase ATPase C chain